MEDSVILWTLLVPGLLEADYGLPPEPVDVRMTRSSANSWPLR